MTGKQHTDRRHTENTRSDITQTKQRHKAHRKNARTGGIYTKKRTDIQNLRTHGRHTENRHAD